MLGGVFHIANQRIVFYEFPLANAAHCAHDPVAHVAHRVDRDDVVGMVRACRFEHYVKIGHARVRCQQQIRGLDPFHSLFANGQLSAPKMRFYHELTRKPH